MKIIRFNPNDKMSLKSTFIRHFQRGTFVPFFGSGFSAGLKARNGTVPSVKELKAKLIELTVKSDGYSERDQEDLMKKNLNEVAEFFWESIYENNSKDSYKEEFDNYIENNFCGVHDIPGEYKALINCGWRYIYTLNYDDAIESASKQKLCVVFPYAPQNRMFLEKQRCLYKIHGDAEWFLKTRNENYCILSTRQYLNAMSSNENSSMCNNLETDFASNDIIFFGCGLIGELDMLFSAGTKLAAKKLQNTDNHCYYVRYMKEGAQELTRLEQREYERYGITDIIEVSHEDIYTFYSFIAEASKEAEKLQKTDSLGSFMGFSFSKLLPIDRDKNIEYLFFSNRILPEKGTNAIVLPSFFLQREETIKIIKNIKKFTYGIHVIRGGRISGKTFALIDILREFQSRDTYFFPSSIRISDEIIDKLLLLKKAVLLFDENTLTNTQIIKITREQSENIKRNELQIVIAIDKSVGMFTRQYYDTFPEARELVKIYMLSSKLNDNEIETFNNELGKLGLIDYKSGWSLLDFMIKEDEASIESHATCLPDINVISDIQTLKAMILFFNQETIPVSQANRMGILETLYNLCKTANVAIQKDYMSEIEWHTEGGHDSFRFITNSKLWTYRCLSTYAKNTTHYDCIADAFADIAQKIKNQYSSASSSRYYQALKPYLFLDSIQFMFFATANGGSLRLADKIYQKLLPQFNDDFQFLHQKAKCLLWQSRRKTQNDKRAQSKLLNEAFQQLNRAYEKLEERCPANMEYTRYHMEVTKALILANDWRYCRELHNEYQRESALPRLLDAFDKMEYDIPDWGRDTLDGILDDREIEDIKWFITELITGETRGMLGVNEKRKAEEIVALAKQIGLYQDK